MAARVIIQDKDVEYSRHPAVQGVCAKDKDTGLRAWGKDEKEALAALQDLMDELVEQNWNRNHYWVGKSK